MAKKLISVWLSLAVLIFSSISIYAEENVTGDFFTRNVVINGETINNNHLQFPFFLYENSTYFPLTPEMGKILGVEAEMDFEGRTLKLLKTEPTLTNITDSWKKNERQDILTQPIDEVQILAYEIEPNTLAKFMEDRAVPANAEGEDDPDNPKGADDEGNTASEENADADDAVTAGAIFDEIIELPELTVTEIELGDLPVLTVGNIVYLPMKAFTEENGFGWDAYYDPYTGVYLSTKAGIPAQSYWNQAQSNYNKGLAAYIRNYNGNYTESGAINMVFLFREAAQIYNINEKILMAVAHKESTFTEKAGEGRSGGALGMMQVMPSTGARYGLGPEQLLNAEISINFGAMYLSERIAAYGGDLTKGFSAYNQGSVSVNRGTYTTRYANRVLNTINGIDSFLTTNGYGLGY